jgi:hypothetical protein
MRRLCQRHTMPLTGETFRPSKRQPFEARPVTGCCTNWLSSSASAMKQFVRPCALREPLALGVGLLSNEPPAAEDSVTSAVEADCSSDQTGAEFAIRVRTLSAVAGLANQ